MKKQNKTKQNSGNNIQQLNQIKQKQETHTKTTKLLMEMVQNPKQDQSIKTK